MTFKTFLEDFKVSINKIAKKKHLKAKFSSYIDEFEDVGVF